jgi:hypothetical protein
MEVAPPDRGQIPAGERRIAGQVGDRLGEAVHQRRPFAFEDVENARGVGRVRAD